VPSKTLRLNGKKVTVDVPDMSQQILYVLREQLEQRGPKFGCGVAQCGACTVLIDGSITRSCVTQLGAIADGADVETLDGLSRGRLHPMQQAFLDQQAGQCAFCMNGMIMGAVGWIQGRIDAGNRSVPSPTEVADFLSGSSPDGKLNYICRCGSHPRIVAAIVAAAAEMV
jgi:aerobic-type carbon monoxide dehydrogenase small subunit (CoxS/CutS family)